MSGRNSCKILTINGNPTGNIRSPRCRLYYPHFFKPQLNKKDTDESKATYQTTLLIPKGSDLTLLQQNCEEAAIKKFGTDYAKKYKVRKPFLKTDDYPKMAAFVEDYPIFLRVKSYNKPEVVFSNKTPCKEDKEHEVYGGRWAFVSLRASAYEPEGNKGVSFWMNNIQLLEDDEPLGGGRVAASDEFEAVDADSAEDLF